MEVIVYNVLPLAKLVRLVKLHAIHAYRDMCSLVPIANYAIILVEHAKLIKTHAKLVMMDII